MPVPDETVRLYLARYGDRWALTGSRHGDGALAGEHPDLAGTLEASGPGTLLELIGHVLDRRETDRLILATALTPTDRGLLADVVRVLEVLEDEPAEELTAGDVAGLAGWGRDGDDAVTVAGIQRAADALEQAQRDGVVQSRRGVGDVLIWSLHPRAREETGR